MIDSVFCAGQDLIYSQYDTAQAIRSFGIYVSFKLTELVREYLTAFR